MAGITKAQAQAKLDLWMAADDAVSRGQSYTIGDRSLSKVDAAEIDRKIDRWDAKVKSLSGGGRKVTRIVPS